MKLLTAATQTDLSLSSLPMLKQSDDKVTLRPATSDDYKFFVDGWPQLKFQMTVVEKEVFVDDVMPNTHIIYSQEYKKDVGYITIRKQGSTSLYINYFLFLSEFQRKGFGTAVLNSIKKESAEKKIQSILLLCDESHEGALEFYKHNGFKGSGFMVHMRYTKPKNEDDKVDEKFKELKTVQPDPESYKDIEKSLGIDPDLFVSRALLTNSLVTTWYDDKDLLVAATIVYPERKIIVVYLNEKVASKSNVKQITKKLAGDLLKADKVDIYGNTRSFDQCFGQEAVLCERFIHMEYKFSS